MTEAHGSSKNADKDKKGRLTCTLYRESVDGTYWERLDIYEKTEELFKVTDGTIRVIGEYSGGPEISVGMGRTTSCGIVLLVKRVILAMSAALRLRQKQIFRAPRSSLTP